MSLSLTINGTPRSIAPRTTRLAAYVNNRRSLRCGVLSVDGTYRPAIEDVIEVLDGATSIFKGKIRTAEERGLTLKSGIVTSVDAQDYSALPERRLVKASTTGGISGRDAIDYLITNYLGVFGITRDAGMAAGATLGELSYDYAPCSDVLNDIVRLAAPDGWVWYIDDSLVLKAFLPGAGVWDCPYSITAAVPNSYGDITVAPSRERYANRVYLTYNDGTSVMKVVSAENAGQIATYGPWEKVFNVPSVIDATAAQGLCNAFLTASLVVPKTVQYTTLTPGARPGMTVSINLPARNINNNFLIMETEAWDLDGKNTAYRVKCIEGSKIAPSWLDMYRTWSGSGSGAATVGGGVVISLVGRATYPLGGSGITGEQGTAGTPITPKNSIPIQLDTTALGAATVTAIVTCWAEAGVTPEIWNTSDTTLAGSGTTVTGMTPTTRIFTITPTAGQKYYLLKLNPNTSNSDVFGHGYLEVGR